MAHELTYIPRGCAPLSNTPKPQNLREALLAAFDPNAPGMRIADLKEFITQLSPGTPIPTKVRLGELQEIACNLRATSPDCLELRSRSASPPLINIKNFNPHAPQIRKADLKNIILQIDSSYHVPSNVTLVELKNMTYRLIHPHRNLPQTSQDQNKRPRSRATSPARPGLRMRSALPALKNINIFDPYALHICKADLQEFILQIDPSSHIPSNTRRAELRDMAYRMIHPQSGPGHASNVQASQSRASSPAQPGHRTRSASPAIISIKNFDPYAPHVKKADLREVIFQIDPCSHVPSNIGLSALRDLVYQMIHPRTVNPQASNADKAPQSRAASPAQSELRLRSDQLPSRSIKNFDPYAPHINKADLREVIFQIDSNSQIPNNIRLAELRNMAFRMIHPHDSLPQEGKKLFPIFLTMCPISDFS
ncbi:hypothetical protein PPACK8108_LOCUS4962 [Phakopsora pachyrhizi]|uniref:Uncharacterized protein n=1 Tax=Phakopsora pachyrhizi TaxID=170000 RepID=A0AAV0AN47_PHAPC|nr:hypothetical protein PPACK8108_LOCUS4962 [Phakopsora pachyrhizi]